jgi:hypothetical protein
LYVCGVGNSADVNATKMKDSKELEGEKLKLQREIDQVKAIEAIVRKHAPMYQSNILTDMLYQFDYDGSSVVLMFPSGNDDWSKEILMVAYNICIVMDSYVKGNLGANENEKQSLIGGTIKIVDLKVKDEYQVE